MVMMLLISQLFLDHTHTCMVDWATVLIHLKKPEEAKSAYKRYFKQLLTLGQQPDTISCQHYATILAMLGKNEKAEKWYALYLEKTKKAHGEYSMMTVDAMLQMANCLEDQRKYKAAIELRRKTLLLLSAIDENHDKVLICMQRIAALLFLLGEEEAACIVMEEAVIRKKKLCGEEHLETLEFMCLFANMLAQAKKTNEAELLLKHLIATYGKVKGMESQYTLRVKIAYCEYPFQTEY